LGKQATTDVQIHKLTEGTFLFCSSQGNILFGCPPEILKRILASHLPMPDTVVVPEKLQHYHSSQASLEFPLYHFLFVQRGLDRKRRFQVVATAPQCDGLAELLRITVVGPTDQEMAKAGTPKGRAEELYQETSHMSLKNAATGKPYTIREMINFYPLAMGEQREIYPVRDKLAAIRLERLGPADFRVLYGEDSYEIDMTVTQEQEPNYKIKHQAFDKSPGRFTLTVLGRSNGFDPNDPANGYILNVDGTVVLWDCPAYLSQHLRKMKLDPKDIDAFVLSHVHEDHIDITESLRDPPFELYTTPEVYFSLLVKLAGVLGCSMEEAKKLHHWHPIDMERQPMDVAGASFQFFHSVHAIPALGVRITKEVNGRRGLLHLSGDHLSANALDVMKRDGGITQRRYDEVNGLLTGEETLVLVDAGGGMIHGDYHDYLDFNGRLGFMHTGLISEELPKGKQLVTSGQVLNVLE
jgi:hypothetical protein